MFTFAIEKSDACSVPVVLKSTRAYDLEIGPPSVSSAATVTTRVLFSKLFQPKNASPSPPALTYETNVKKSSFTLSNFAPLFDPTLDN